MPGGSAQEKQRGGNAATSASTDAGVCSQHTINEHGLRILDRRVRRGSQSTSGGSEMFPSLVRQALGGRGSRSEMRPLYHCGCTHFFKARSICTARILPWDVVARGRPGCHTMGFLGFRLSAEPALETSNDKDTIVKRDSRYLHVPASGPSNLKQTRWHAMALPMSLRFNGATKTLFAPKTVALRIPDPIVEEVNLSR